METLIPKLEQNLLDKFSYIPNARRDMAVSTELGPTIIESGLRSNMFNIVVSSGEEDFETIQKVKVRYAEQGLPFAWWVGFESDPAELSEWLSQEGLKNDEEELGMYMPLDRIPVLDPNDAFNIKAVHDATHLKDFITVLSTLLPDESGAIERYFGPSLDALNDAPLTLFVGYLDGKPIATASAYSEDEVAGIYDIIVLPENRGQKIGSRMTLAAMQYAQEVYRAEYAVLTATNDAKHLYNKLGFQDLKPMGVFHN